MCIFVCFGFHTASKVNDRVCMNLFDMHSSNGEKCGTCPVCSLDGRISKLRLFQLNFKEAVSLCEYSECTYPMSSNVSTPLIVQRPFMTIPVVFNVRKSPKRKPRVKSPVKLKKSPLRTKQRINKFLNAKIMQIGGSEVRPSPGSAAGVTTYFQWENRDALCWLDVLLCTFVHCRTVRVACRSHPGVVSQLCTEYDRMMSSTGDITEGTERSAAPVMSLDEFTQRVYTTATSSDPTHTPDSTKRCPVLNDRVALTNHDSLATRATATGAGSPCGTERNGRIRSCQRSRIMESARETVWQFLNPALRCEKGRNHSPVFALPLLVKEDPHVHDLFNVKYETEFRCAECGCHKITSFEEVLLTVSSRLTELAPPVVRMSRACRSSCKATDQPFTISATALSPCLMMHFVNGIHTSDLNSLDFTAPNSQRYRVSVIIQHCTNPDHFVAWIRDLKSNKWMACDDMGGPECHFDQQSATIPPSQVHMVLWENIISWRAAATDDPFKCTANITPTSHSSLIGDRSMVICNVGVAKRQFESYSIGAVVCKSDAEKCPVDSGSKFGVCPNDESLKKVGNLNVAKNGRERDVTTVCDVNGAFSTCVCDRMDTSSGEVARDVLVKVEAEHNDKTKPIDTKSFDSKDRTVTVKTEKKPFKDKKSPYAKRGRRKDKGEDSPIKGRVSDGRPLRSTRTCKKVVQPSKYIKKSVDFVLEENSEAGRTDEEVTVNDGGADLSPEKSTANTEERTSIVPININHTERLLMNFHQKNTLAKQRRWNCIRHQISNNEKLSRVQVQPMLFGKTLSTRCVPKSAKRFPGYVPKCEKLEENVNVNSDYSTGKGRVCDSELFKVPHVLPSKRLKKNNHSDKELESSDCVKMCAAMSPDDSTAVCSVPEINQQTVHGHVHDHVHGASPLKEQLHSGDIHDGNVEALATGHLSHDRSVDSLLFISNHSFHSCKPSINSGVSDDKTDVDIARCFFDGYPACEMSDDIGAIFDDLLSAPGESHVEMAAMCNLNNSRDLVTDISDELELGATRSCCEDKILTDLYTALDLDICSITSTRK